MSSALQPQSCDWFRLLRVRSPLLTQSLTISFPHPTEMFQFGWSPAFCYFGLSAAFTKHFPVVTPGGLPHSETAGSMDYNSSPTTIVVIYVLPRYEHPRHPLSTCSVAENKGSIRLGRREHFVHIQRNLLLAPQSSDLPERRGAVKGNVNYPLRCNYLYYLKF